MEEADAISRKGQSRRWRTGPTARGMPVCRCCIQRISRIKLTYNQGAVELWLRRRGTWPKLTLRTERGRGYAWRKAIAEPVFGQVKEGRGFRGFFLRGFGPVSADWQLVCLAHNVLKLFRYGPRLRPVEA